MRVPHISKRLWFRLAVWFVAFLTLFFVLFIVAFLLVDFAFVESMTEGDKQAYFAADDRVSELDPVPEEAAFLLVLLVAIPLSVLASVLIALRITRPITQVGAVAQLVVNGDLSARAHLPRNQQGSEIGTLIENVNSLLDMVQASDTRVRTDAAAIAHELRTPLAALQMKLHGMIDGVVPVSGDELKRLLAQTQVLARVVDDLRTLSLASQGALTLVRSQTDLLRLAQSAVEMHARPLDEAGIAAQVGGDTVVAQVDPDRLRQTLSNLIENAIRYASEGGVIDIHVCEEQGQAVLRVADRGPGLGVSFQSVVFEPFQRAEASRSREFGGSGLGLSIVKAIAEAHGGTVQAHTRDGGGLEIALTLPMREN